MLASNTVNNGSLGGTFQYSGAARASRLWQQDGRHYLQYAASGSVGGNISWLTACSTTTSGNLAFPSGQGIDFSAAGGDVLTTYDEGTFTPVWNGGTVTVSLSKFTRIGRQVTWIYDLTFGASVDVAASTLTLPFACVDNWGAGSINFTDIGAALFVNLDGSIDALQFRAVANGASLACSTVATKRVVGIVTYNA
jgi:hypothetical protein